MILDLAFLLILIAWSALVGRAVLVRLAAPPTHATDALALAVPLGLGALALALLGLGELGLLGARGVVGVLIAGVGMALWRPAPDRTRATIADRAVRGPIDRIIDSALVVGVLGTLLTALAPVTDGDALCYHLQVPKVFLARGAVGFEPDLHETVYPLVTEMLYAAALALRGPVTCRLIQWALGLVFAANVAALARPVLGPRARWAAAVALLVPAVSNGMSAPLNDVALAAFAAAALHAAVRWLDRPAAGAAVLAGLLAGLAAGVKYPALVWTGLLGLLIAAAEIARRPDSRPQIRGRDSLGFAVAVALVGGPWYLRALYHTGNPVYPFFRGVFGAGLAEVLDPIRRPMAPTAANLATALGAMTLDPGRFDSLSHQFGPAFLLMLPALVALKAPRRVWGLAAFGGAFLTLCLTQRQSMRFVLAALGPLAVAVAWVGVAAWERRTIPGRALATILLLILGAEATLGVARARHGLRVVLGRESAAAYLDRREPTHRVGRWIDAHLPRDARLIGQDHRGFYIPRPYAMELAHRRRTGLGTRGESADAIVETLRRAGFTHLLLAPPEPETAVEFDPTLGRRLASWLRDHPPLYREPLADADGVVRRYAIYELSAAPEGRARR